MIFTSGGAGLGWGVGGMMMMMYFASGGAWLGWGGGRGVHGKIVYILEGGVGVGGGGN